MGDAGDWAEAGRDRRDEAIQRGRHVPLSQHGRLSLRLYNYNYDTCWDYTNSIPALFILLFY